MANNTKNIMIVGVGGQGTLLTLLGNRNTFGSKLIAL